MTATTVTLSTHLTSLLQTLLLTVADGHASLSIHIRCIVAKGGLPAVDVKSWL